MKKFLMFLTCLILCGSAYGQQYDEVDLLGKWDVINLNGRMSKYFYSFKSILFSDTEDDGYYSTAGAVYEAIEPDEDPWECVLLQDFFISNGNKLHILFSDNYTELGSIRFIIQSFTDNEINLSSYDGKCTFTLRKNQQSSAPVLRADSLDTPAQYYDINGIPLSEPQNGLNIVVHSGDAQKILVK